MRPALFLVPGAMAMPAFAAEALAQEGGGGILQLLVPLLLLVTALGAVAWVLKRYASPAIGASGLLRIVASQSVGPREKLVIVEFGDAWILVGITSQNITSLNTMPRQELTQAVSAGGGFDFSSLLSKARRSHETG